MSRPGLWARLGASARVTVVSASAGSGKTVLLRSWIAEAGLADRVAWVPAAREDRDPQRFWLSVLGALRTTSAGSALVRALTAAPDLDGWAIVERLLEDLAPLRDRLWLVIDDPHELGADQELRQPREDVDEAALTPAAGQTFCPYKGVCSYFDIGDARRGAWSYQDPYPEVGRIADLVSFEPDKVEVSLDDARLRLEPGQSVVPHGVDRDLTLDEAGPRS